MKPSQATEFAIGLVFSILTLAALGFILDYEPEDFQERVEQQKKQQQEQDYADFEEYYYQHKY